MHMLKAIVCKLTSIHHPSISPTNSKSLSSIFPRPLVPTTFPTNITIKAGIDTMRVPKIICNQKIYMCNRNTGFQNTGFQLTFVS